MSEISRATSKSIYSSTSGTFADNSTREISEGDMRQFADDIIDSVVTRKDDYNYWLKVITGSGTDTYTISETIPAAYATDEKWLIRFTNSNTGASTLNRNSLGAKDLKDNTGGALSAGQIVAGGIYIVNYNGTEYRILNVVSASGGISGLTTNRIPYATSATTIGDDSNLVWSPTNKSLTVSNTGSGMAMHVGGSSGTLNNFIGYLSGNFTMTGGYNSGFGPNTLDALTTGNYNTAIGYNAGTAINSGSLNTAIGYEALGATVSAVRNTGIGGLSMALATGGYNTGLGYLSGYNITTGTHNVAIGHAAYPPSATANGGLSIQNIIYGTGNSATDTSISTGNIGIGEKAPDRRFHITVSDASTNAVTYAQRITHESSGTTLSGFGAGIETELENGSGTNVIASKEETVWTDPTNASEDADKIFYTIGAGSLTEKMRITSSGSVGIGTTTPSSYSYDSNAQLVVASSGNSSVNIVSGTASYADLAFADGTTGADRYRGLLRYDHTNNDFSFWTNGSEQVKISSSGRFIVNNSHTPSSASDTGTTGTIAWDTNYIYICTATDTWKRVAIATW